VAAHALALAERALLKSVETDKVSRRMELLGNLPAAESPLAKLGHQELPLAAHGPGVPP